MTDKPGQVSKQVIPQEETEAPGSSELLESGVHKLPQQEESEIGVFRQQGGDTNVLSEGLFESEPQSDVAAFTKPAACTEEPPSSDDENASCNLTREATAIGFQTKRSQYVSGMQQFSEDCQKASHQVQKLFKKFPSALGLILLVACLEAPVEGLKQLVGVEKGADTMEDTFRKLGYAILRLPTNISSLQLKAMMKAVTEISYPESYKRIFFYFTGHGTDNAIYTPDAAVSQNEIVLQFQCKHVWGIPKVFIFDCCRDRTLTHSTCDAPNTMIIYSTMSGGQAYAPYDESGVMTTKLAELLLTRRDPITVIVAELSQGVQDHHMRPVVRYQLQQSISLLKEKDAAMCPRCVRVRKHIQSATVTWEFPRLGKHFGLQGFTVLGKESTSSDWKVLNSDDHQPRHFDILASEFPSLFCGSVNIAVQAEYHGKSVRSEVRTLCMTTEGGDRGCLEKLCGSEGSQRQQSKRLWICLLFLLGIVAIGVGVGVGFGVGFGLQLRPSSPRKVSGFNGDTVECDQLSGLFTKQVQVSECGEYNNYCVGTYITEGQLKTYEWISEEFDGVQPATVGRFNIPVNVDRVPYLYEGSTITMSVCLQSTNATTSPARLLVFDDLDERKSYTEGKADGETSVYQQQLPVGSLSQMQCSNVVYNVTHVGYYCVALESPSGVIFKENLTENVISVNSSEYQVSCTVGKSDPCNIDIPFSSSVRILCHIPKEDPHDPTPQSTSLCSSQRPRCEWTIPFIVIGVAVSLLFFVISFCLLLWLIVQCQKYRPRNGYIDLSIQN